MTTGFRLVARWLACFEIEHAFGSSTIRESPRPAADD
jgi:hypothetical protein